MSHRNFRKPFTVAVGADRMKEGDKKDGEKA